jgi:hypothetical protein
MERHRSYMLEEERVGLDQVTVLDQGERVEVIEAPRIRADKRWHRTEPEW